MPSCPSCGGHVRTRSLLEATGLSGVVCPSCSASLWPRYWSSALLLAVSLVLATLTRMLARYLGVGFPVDLVILLLALVFFYVLFCPLIIRLRPKQSAGESLKV